MRTTKRSSWLEPPHFCCKRELFHAQLFPFCTLYSEPLRPMASLGCSPLAPWHVLMPLLICHQDGCQNFAFLLSPSVTVVETTKSNLLLCMVFLSWLTSSEISIPAKANLDVELWQDPGDQCPHVFVVDRDLDQFRACSVKHSWPGTVRNISSPVQNIKWFQVRNSSRPFQPRNERALTFQLSPAQKNMTSPDPLQCLLQHGTA